MGSINFQQGEAFSVATLFYARLRRVSSRVIDVMYLIENKEYALYIFDLAEKTKDQDLLNYTRKLTDLLQLNHVDEQQEPAVLIRGEASSKHLNFKVDAAQVSDEDIYKAQVSHHYIGALR